MTGLVMMEAQIFFPERRASKQPRARQTRQSVTADMAEKLVRSSICGHLEAIKLTSVAGNGVYR